MKKMLFVVCLLVSLFSCSEKEEDKIVQDIFNPSNFKIEVNSLDFNSAKIVWTKSTIEDNSEITYDVYLDKVLLVEGLNTIEYSIDGLKEATLYSVKIIAKSNYNTKKESVFSFTTKTTPEPLDLILHSSNIAAESFSISWDDTDDANKYDIYLNSNKVVSDLSTSSYTFTNLKALSKYSVKVCVKNVYGKFKESIIELSTVDYNSPEDFSLRIHNLSPHSASISWTKPIDTSGLEYKLFLNGKEVHGFASNYFFEFQNLQENTVYNAKLVVTNKYSKFLCKEISFTTSIVQKPADFNIQVINITKESALILWKPVVESINPISYKVFINGYFKGEFFSERLLELKSLTPSKEYVVKVEASNYLNNKLAKEVSFITKAETTLSDFKVRASVVKAFSARIEWDNCIASDGQNVKYNVYSNDSRDANRWYNTNSNLSSNFIELSNLKPNSTYTYKIVATACESFISKESLVTFTTNRSALPTDFKVSVSEIKETSALINWTSSVLTYDEPNTDYLIYDITVNSSTVRCVYSAGFNSQIVTGLTPGTDYECVVKASNSFGEEKIKRCTFRTKAEKVFNLSFSAQTLTPSSIKLSWDFNDRPDVRYYDIYKGKDFVKSVFNGANKYFLIDNLISNTEYSFRIVAVCARDEHVEKLLSVKTLKYNDINDFNILVDAQIY